VYLDVQVPLNAAARRYYISVMASMELVMCTRISLGLALFEASVPTLVLSESERCSDIATCIITIQTCRLANAWLSVYTLVFFSLVLMPVLPSEPLDAGRSKDPEAA